MEICADKKMKKIRPLCFVADFQMMRLGFGGVEMNHL